MGLMGFQGLAFGHGHAANGKVIAAVFCDEDAHGARVNAKLANDRLGDRRHHAALLVGRAPLHEVHFQDGHGLFLQKFDEMVSGILT